MMTKTLGFPVPQRVPAELLLRHSTPAQDWQLTSPQSMLRAWGMSPYRPTRREFLIGAAGLLVLAPYGCGSGEESGQGGETTADGTRTVDTPRGQVTIPAEPQRLVALYTHDLENALVLGLPVTAGPGEQGLQGTPFPPYLVEMFGEELDGVSRITHRPELNFEQLAELQPDVILSGIFGDDFDPGFGRLEEIAPLVTYMYYEGEEATIVPWREVLRQNGEQFASETAAGEWIERFEERAAELRERLTPRWAGATYAVVEPYPEGFYVYGRNAGHTADTLVEELGLAVADSANRLVSEAGEVGQGGASISYEKLGALDDADIIFIPVAVGADGTPDRSGIEALTAQQIWSRLPAAQAGQVHEFTNNIRFESAVTAMVFLDVVENSLLG